MEARERQAIITALAARSGSELETFFRSHGLANAYRSRQGAGKEQRINDALDAGDHDGSGDDLLRDAVRHFGLADAKGQQSARTRIHATAQDDSRMFTVARTERLHPNIQEASASYVRDSHMAAAVFEAFKAVENRVKDMTTLDTSGQDLMARAFGGSPTPIRLNEGRTQSDSDEQEGFKLIFMGAARGIRNPKAHEPFGPLDDERAFDYLAFASLLMRRLDDAQTIGAQSG